MAASRARAHVDRTSVAVAASDLDRFPTVCVSRAVAQLACILGSAVTLLFGPVGDSRLFEVPLRRFGFRQL